MLESIVESIALNIGLIVIQVFLGLLAFGIVLLICIAFYRLRDYIRSRRGVIARRINKRYRLLIKVKEGLGSVDPELDRLIRDSIELDTMIYAYIYDKEAYEKIKADKRLRATTTEIPTEEVQ